jgi:hypothetical protein
MRWPLAALVAVLLLAGIPGPAAAQEAAPAPEPSLYAFGTVKSVTGSELVVSEYDPVTDADVTVAYAVATDAEFMNASGLRDLAPGDAVDLTYLEEGGRRTAIAILVEKLAQIQEPPVPDDVYSEE